MRPSAMTARRSDRFNASLWSWVTKIVVTPSLRWISRSSTCIEARKFLSSAENGSSSRRTLRIDHQSARQRDALLLAAGKLARLAILVTRELDQRQRVRDPPLDFGLRHVAHLEAIADIGRDRHVREQRVILKHHADLALIGRHVVDPFAGDQDFSAVRAEEPRARLRTVVLPQPDGPSSVMNSPRRIANEISCSAVTSPKRLVTP